MPGDASRVHCTNPHLQCIRQDFVNCELLIIAGSSATSKNAFPALAWIRRTTRLNIYQREGFAVTVIAIVLVEGLKSTRCGGVRIVVVDTTAWKSAKRIIGRLTKKNVKSGATGRPMARAVVSAGSL
eukprot:scaffold7126_cov142-Skeletonema_menzelii.AAC.9